MAFIKLLTHRAMRGALAAISMIAIFNAAKKGQLFDIILATTLL